MVSRVQINRREGHPPHASPSRLHRHLQRPDLRQRLADGPSLVGEWTFRAGSGGACDCSPNRQRHRLHLLVYQPGGRHRSHATVYEWGTSFRLDEPGRWQLTVRRGGTTASVPVTVTA